MSKKQEVEYTQYTLKTETYVEDKWLNHNN